MALHHQLPIFKDTYDLLSLVVAMTKNMPRDFKASMGGKLRDECLEISVAIFHANVATDKIPYLDKVIQHQQVAELLLRLSRDLHLISTKQYAETIRLTGSIGKQANGWRKSASRLFHES
jgi:hypothetical protein